MGAGEHGGNGGQRQGDKATRGMGDRGKGHRGAREKRRSRGPGFKLSQGVALGYFTCRLSACKSAIVVLLPDPKALPWAISPAGFQPARAQSWCCFLISGRCPGLSYPPRFIGARAGSLISRLPANRFNLTLSAAWPWRAGLAGRGGRCRREGRAGPGRRGRRRPYKHPFRTGGNACEAP